MNKRNFEEDEENLNNRNINMQGNVNYNQRGISPERRNINLQAGQNESQTAPMQGENFMNNFLTNPREAIAKEVMERAGEQLKKSWMDRFKCNIE
jgi:hypothetical protein